MPLDNIENFVRGDTDESVDSTQTTISVVDASIFPDPSVTQYNLVLWDDYNYPRPDQDANVEVVRVSGRDTTNNNLTVSRGEEGTAAASHPNDSALQLSPTEKVFTDIESQIDSHSTRHGYGGDDELATALKYDPQSEPSTPTDGVVRWYDSTDDAFKAKFSDGSIVTIAQL